MDVLIDLDIGLHRTGVKPEEALALAELILSHKNLRLRGIQAYAGQVQHIPSYAERMAASQRCLQAAVEVFCELRGLERTCDIFSATGTGTYDIDLAVPEVTELQAGSYACMDAQYRGIGSAEDEAQFLSFGPALRLLTTVVSVNQENFVTVDAGLKALYRDGGVPLVYNPSQMGLTYDWFGDEYGRIIVSGNATALPLGSTLELIPSHCDPTINLFDRFYLTRGDEVVGAWQIDLRGCSQ
jgi:D-serine deaminase-like pyridoxal phosphate-dependent protein